MSMPSFDRGAHAASPMSKITSIRRFLYLAGVFNGPKYVTMTVIPLAGMP